MIPAISQVCSLASSFPEDIEDYAAGHCSAVELWLTKVETYLQHHELAELRDVFHRHQMQTPAASYQGGLFSPDDAARAEAWRLFQSRLNLCQELNVPVLIVAADGPAPRHADDILQLNLWLSQAAEVAAQKNVRLALEFQGRAPFCNNLATAAAIVEEVDHPSLGICLDLYQFYVGPSKFEDLKGLRPERLLHVQLSDMTGVPRELATDADRILPGEGDMAVAPLVDYLRAIDYRGCVSVEILNPRIWQIPPRQFGEIAITALRRVLGQASMDA